MNLSVVIPSYNARDALQILLLSLDHCELDPTHALQVVVVDDGSEDGTGDMVAALRIGFELTYVFIPRTAASGRAAARNAGIRRATGDVVVMVDADQIVPPDFLAAHLRCHELSPNVVVIGPRGDIEPRDIDPARFAESFTLPPVTGRDDRELVFAEFSANLNNLATCWHYLFSCNVSVRLDHVRAVGGFDEGYSGWGLEDSDLGYRLWRAGLSFAYIPGAILYHRQKQVVTSDMYRQWRRNLAYFISKYDTPEVAAQSILDHGLGLEISWLESSRRFEHACRALQGRSPRSVAFEVLEVDEASLDDALDRLPGRAAEVDLLVIDRTAGDRLAAAVQCTTTSRELLYFHRPTAAQRHAILARYDAEVAL